MGSELMSTMSPSTNRSVERLTSRIISPGISLPKTASAHLRDGRAADPVHERILPEQTFSNAEHADGDPGRQG